MPDTAGFMDQRRAEIGKIRDELNAQIAELQGKLADLDKEWKALEAYDRIMHGEAPRPAASARPADTGSRQRAPRGERQGQILDVIRTNPGIDTSGICEKLGISDDKGVASIRAAIFQLGKKGQIEKEGKGRYIVAEAA